MIEALQAASENAAKKRPKGDELSIDMNRLSRIFFVSGEPGSGKTTLYLTLKAMLSSKSEYSKYREGCDEGRIGGLEEPAVRWLEPIDLEVAGEEGENLLAAVLVRLVRKLDESKSGFSKSCGEAIKKLEQLTADIGMAWDGNLQERASALDPDMFSMEVMRAQRARLGVNERLREALDELAENDCCGCRSNTLFVLPVDDLYLNPNASLQLLRLLRMISVPRLFFLVMGDITTLEAIFVEKALADWTAVAGAEVFQARPARLDEALARARELRARFLRKLLPPGQRAVIEVMEWDEALGFKPEPRDGKGDKTATLNSLLDVDLDPPPQSTTHRDAGSVMTLLNHLISPPFDLKQGNKVKSSDKDKASSEKDTENERATEEQEKQEKKAREAYTALQILDATPREIMDLWSTLNELSHPDEIKDKGQKTDDAIPRLLSRVVEFVQLVIEEQNFLNEDEQESLRVVLPTRHYSPRDIRFAMDRLGLEPDPDPWTDIDKSLWFRKHRSWKLTVKGGVSNEGAEPFAKMLPPRPIAWLVLLHDLAWEWNPESVSGNLVKSVLDGLDKWSQPEFKASAQSKRDANTEVKKLRLQHLINLMAMLKKDDGPAEIQKLDPPNDLQGWAVWHKESGYEHFPIPKLETFRDLDRFLFVWSSGLDWLSDLKKQADNALKQAVDAQEKADIAKRQAETDETQRDEAKKAQERAEVAKAQADETQERIGEKPQYVSKLIYLWGLAGLTVNDSSYEGFANRKEDWFETHLKKTFENDIAVDDKDKNWREDIDKLKNSVLATLNRTPQATP